MDGWANIERVLVALADCQVGRSPCAIVNIRDQIEFRVDKPIVLDTGKLRINLVRTLHVAGDWTGLDDNNSVTKLLQSVRQVFETSPIIDGTEKSLTPAAKAGHYI